MKLSLSLKLRLPLRPSTVSHCSGPPGSHLPYWFQLEATSGSSMCGIDSLRVCIARVKLFHKFFQIFVCIVTDSALKSFLCNQRYVYVRTLAARQE